MKICPCLAAVLPHVWLADVDLGVVGDVEVDGAVERGSAGDLGHVALPLARVVRVRLVDPDAAVALAHVHPQPEPKIHHIPNRK